MNNYEFVKINDLSIERQDAVDRCYNLGKKFLEHFDKIYNNQENQEVINHWSNEMISWYEAVKTLRLKQNNKHLSMTNLRDWFFTACAEPKDFFTSNNKELEEEIYDKFYLDLLNTNDIKQSLKNVGLMI